MERMAGVRRCGGGRRRSRIDLGNDGQRDASERIYRLEFRLVYGQGKLFCLLGEKFRTVYTVADCCADCAFESTAGKRSAVSRQPSAGKRRPKTEDRRPIVDFLHSVRVVFCDSESG